MTRLGILLSGRGSNFLAIADSVADGRLDAKSRWCSPTVSKRQALRSRESVV